MSLSSNPTWVEVNLSAIEHNTRIIKEAVKVPMMAVVKDDGYGHGAVETAKTFLASGGTWLGVVRCHEGLELRQAGIEAPTLVFGGILPDEMDSAINAHLAIPVYNFEVAEIVSRRALALGKTALVHLKVDTGMGRFGVFAEDALSLAQHVQDLGGMKIDGIFSHFSAAGDDEELTWLQLKRFKSALQSLRSAGINPEWVHMANSSAIISVPEAYFNMVRVGGILYGMYGERKYPFSAQPRPAFTWKARLMSCRRFPEGWGVGYDHTYTTHEGELIGVVPVGHGDGFRRSPQNEVLIGGKRVPVVGLVCMDQCMVSLPEWQPMGTEIVLLGNQGKERITSGDLRKRWSCTYSGTTLVHPRVPRVYVRD